MDAVVLNEILDKLYIQSLHQIEDKMEKELAIEAALNEGSIHLAKSRYIMGQNSVSRLRLPTEDSHEFSASVSCHREEQEGIIQFQVKDNKSEDTVHPMKWFGVLVPQNLHRAQTMFQNGLEYAVECANIQILLAHTLESIQLLNKAKNVH